MTDDLFDKFVRLKWPDEVLCRYCGSAKVYFISTVKRWNCKACHRQFTLKTGTVLQYSPLTLAVWDMFFRYIVETGEPASYNAIQVIGVTQKTTWIALRKLRAMLEVDEEEGVANYIDREKQIEIIRLRALGHSVRRIAELAGCSKVTVQRYMKSVADKMDNRPEPTYGTKALLCDNCKIRPVREDCEFWRPTRRTGHKFCSVKCYGEWRTAQKVGDRCKRCGVQRTQARSFGFTQGYCAYCYGVLREFGFDHDAAEIFHTNQTLKKETREWQQEHGSPSSLRTPPISAKC